MQMSKNMLQICNYLTYANVKKNVAYIKICTLKCAYNQDVFLIKKPRFQVCLKTRRVSKRDALVLATLRYLLRFDSKDIRAGFLLWSQNSIQQTTPRNDACSATKKKMFYQFYVSALDSIVIRPFGLQFCKRF